MKQQLVNQLEQLIDREGMGNVLAALVDVCQEKAAHLAENWQDDKLAKQWEKTGNELNKCSAKLSLVCPLY